MTDVRLSEVETAIAETRKLLADRAGARGASLRTQLVKARRQLPWGLRWQSRSLHELEPLLAHPQLAKRVDAAETMQQLNALKTHLKTVDPLDRVKGNTLGVLAVIAANTLMLLALIWLVQAAL